MGGGRRVGKPRAPGAIASSFLTRSPHKLCLNHSPRHGELTAFFRIHQVVDSERTRIMSRNRSSSKMPGAAVSSRPTSSGDCSHQNRTGKWLSSSSSSRPPTAQQRLHHLAAVDDRSSPVARNSPVAGRAAALRGFERLAISAERRK
ncbi:hypothetical protein ABZP36_030815 [Zizania latifolia]